MIGETIESNRILSTCTLVHRIFVAKLTRSYIFIDTDVCALIARERYRLTYNTCHVYVNK